MCCLCRCKHECLLERLFEMIEIVFLVFFSSFQLLPLGVATADLQCPIFPARHIPIWHSNYSYVLSYHIYEPHLWSSFSPFTWQIQAQYPFTNIFCIPSLHMPIPPQSSFPNLVSNLPYLSSTLNKLILNFVHFYNSQRIS